MGTPMYWRNKLLLFKRETAYASDAAPLAANAMRGYDVNFTPMDVTTEDLETIQPYMGAGDTEVVAVQGKFDFKIRAAGSGTAGLAPPYAPAFLASGLAETVAADTKVDYAPVSAGFASATVYFYLAGDLHVFVGARSNVTFNLEAGKGPYWQFSVLGLYRPVTTGAMPGPVDYSAYKAPVLPSATNTPTASLHGFAAEVKSLSLDLGQKVEYDQLVNTESVDITDRASTAKLVIRRPPVAVHDFFAAVAAKTLGPLAVIHGITAGNIIGVNAPAAQIVKLSQSVDKGKVYLELDLSLKPVAGNDEVLFTLS
jgi:hypothetical protein